MEFKTNNMKTAIVKISALVEVPELKSFYSPQSFEELANSIKEDGGMKIPIVVNEKYEIIDGYRRKDVMVSLGNQYINVIIEDVEATVYEHIIRNLYRTKITDDFVNELLFDQKKLKRRLFHFRVLLDS